MVFLNVPRGSWVNERQIIGVLLLHTLVTQILRGYYYYTRMNNRSGRGGGRAGGRGRGGRGGRGRGGRTSGQSSAAADDQQGRGRGGGGGGGRGRGGRGGRSRGGTTTTNNRAPPAASSSAPALKNGEKGASAHTVGESYRIRLTRLLMELREDDARDQLEFPPALTNTERKFVHELAAQLGLKSKSTGKGEQRHIKVTKLNPEARRTNKAGDGGDGDAEIPILKVGTKGVQELQRHLQRFPPTHLEELESRETGASLVEAFAQNNNGDDDNNAAVRASLQHLGVGVRDAPIAAPLREKRVDLSRRRKKHAAIQASKPKHPDYGKLKRVRAQLPAYRHQQEIVEAVATHQVTIVSGETGCGM